MKTLSVKNPWGDLLVRGIKDVENRTWKTSYRGRLLIHAPQAIDQNYRNMSLLFTPEQWDSLSVKDQRLMFTGIFTCSAIIGEVELVDCVKDSKSVWASPDSYHWIVKNAVMYKEPILNVKGKLSLWEYNFEK